MTTPCDRLLAFVVLSAAAACGGTASDLVFSGTVSGRAFAPTSAAAGPLSFSAHQNVGEIFLGANAGDLCAQALADEQRPSAQYLNLLVFQQDASGTSTPPVPGTYTVLPGAATGAGKWAGAGYWRNDASCAEVEYVKANSGTVTLTAVEATRYQGSFDLSLATGDHVTGSFTSTVCGNLARISDGVCR